MEKQYQELFQKAVNDFKNKNYQISLQSFSKLIEQFPDRYSPYINRATIYIQLFLDKFAMPDLNKAIQIDPSDQVAYFNRFILNMKTGKKSQALEDLYIALSCANVKRGIKTQQLRYFTKAISLVENNIYAYIQRGNLYRNSGNSRMALNDYNGALEIDERNIIVYALRANLYKSQKNEKQALNDLKMVLDLKKENKKNQIILQPQINKKLNQNQINVEIQNKLKDFIEIRNLIYQNKEKEIPVQIKPSLKKEIQSKNSNNSENNDSSDLNITQKMLKMQEEIKKLSEQGEFKNENETKKKEGQQNNSGEEEILLEFSNPNEQKSTRKQENLLISSKNQDINQFQGFQDIKNINKQEQINLLDVSIQDNAKIIKKMEKYIQIQITSATLSRSTEKYGNMSPYCYLTYCGQTKSTKVHSKGGKNPQWKQSFSFLIKQSPSLKIQVFDRDSTTKSDEIIGSGTISIYDNGNKLILKYDNKNAGIIYFKIKIH